MREGWDTEEAWNLDSVNPVVAASNAGNTCVVGLALARSCPNLKHRVILTVYSSLWLPVLPLVNLGLTIGVRSS